MVKQGKGNKELSMRMKYKWVLNNKPSKFPKNQ